MLHAGVGLGTFQVKGISQTDKWTVSPVCSRLRDHIAIMNSNSFKDRLFLQSPMTNKFNWALASPQIDSSSNRYANMCSTAQNTATAASKYGYHANSYEGFSEHKD